MKTLKLMLVTIGLSSLLQANTTLANNQVFDNDFAQMQKVFNAFKQNFMNDGFNFNNLNYPKVNMKETKDKYIIEYELAGIDKKNIKLMLHDNYLILEGERKSSKKDKTENYLRQEIFYGKFQRTIALPKDALVDKMTNSYKNGILVVQIPRNKKESSNYKILKIN